MEIWSVTEVPMEDSFGVQGWSKSYKTRPEAVAAVIDWYRAMGGTDNISIDHAPPDADLDFRMPAFGVVVCVCRSEVQ